MVEKTGETFQKQSRVSREWRRASLVGRRREF